jgi:polyisoprenoid-binding protein YceI
MESDTYPRAVFKGTISNLDTNKISTEGIVLAINGKIKIHGVTQNITVKAMLTKVANGLQLTTDFDLNTDDFKIEIPSMILPKISKTVHTHLNCTLQ